MDIDDKVRCLDQAVGLTKVALSNNSSNRPNIDREDAAALFLETAYKKLKELREDALTD